MKRTISGLFSLAFLLIVFTISAPAEDTIRLTNGNWPPFMGEELPDGGACSKIVQEAFSLVGIKVEYGFFPWKRSLILAKRNEWDGSIVWTESSERRANFYFSDPVIVQQDVLFTLKDKPLEWKSLDELKGLRIGITRGYFYGEPFAKALKDGLFEADVGPTDEAGLRKVLAGRIAGMAVTKDVGLEILRQHFSPEERSKFTYSKTVLRESPYMLILNKVNPNNKNRIFLFNKGLEELKQNGSYQMILDDLEQGKYTIK